jgi:hypothetical protein
MKKKRRNMARTMRRMKVHLPDLSVGYYDEEGEEIDEEEYRRIYEQMNYN